MRDAAIFDVDGTLCDITSVRHHVETPGKPRDFRAFHAGSIDCPPIPGTVEHVERERRNGRAILIVTAREAIWSMLTLLWLKEHNIDHDGLYMRCEGDYRKDFDVKRDILAEIRREFNVVHAYDDNPAVIELWRLAKIPTTVIPGWTGTY